MHYIPELALFGAHAEKKTDHQYLNPADSLYGLLPTPIVLFILNREYLIRPWNSSQSGRTIPAIMPAPNVSRRQRQTKP